MLPEAIQEITLKGLSTCSAGWDNAVSTLAWDSYRGVYVVSKKDSDMWCEFYGRSEEVCETINKYFSVVVNKPATKIEALIFDTDLGCYRFVTMDIEE